MIAHNADGAAGVAHAARHSRRDDVIPHLALRLFHRVAQGPAPLLDLSFVERVSADEHTRGVRTGRVRLVAWAAATSVIDRLHELSARFAKGDTTTVPELHRLQDRYRRVRVEPDGRITLPLAICVHLAVVGASTIFVASFADHVELWSVAYRTARLADEHDDGLP